MFWRKRIEQRLTSIEAVLVDKHQEEIQRHHTEEERLRQLHQRDLAEQARNTSESMEERFGICALEMSSEIEILDLDGAVRLRRRCKGFRVKKIAIDRILHWFGTTHPDAQWREKPSLVDCQGNNNQDFQIVPHFGAGLSKYRFHVVINPPAKDGDELSYGFQTSFTCGVAMSEEGARAAAEAKTSL